MSVIMKAQFLLSRLRCVTEDWKKLGLIYQEACFLVLFSKAPSKARNIFFFIDLATYIRTAKPLCQPSFDIP